MNVLIPMAGQGSRFAKEGYEKPKPFIDVDGKPMIERIINNLKIPNANYILIARQEHLDREKELKSYLEKEYGVKFIVCKKLTEGTACTALLAYDEINNEQPLLIANSDQLVNLDINEFLNDAKSRKLDGSILTFKDEELNPKWSFAKIDKSSYVTEVREKEAISEHATVGIYLFNKGSEFIRSAVQMIVNNDRVNNEFYTCPVYNYSIKSGAKIGIYDIKMADMHGIGTPQDLNKFLENEDKDIIFQI
ncbi:glycosyltransferase family 2 protein [Halobacteriovorax sp. DPLXC-1]|uniref:glycosyltransferase family 2 protein n=1 Tax=Halobacteriovorax sp. DPLXC-1 TaxID=3110771 RepID=UPI003FA60BFB